MACRSASGETFIVPITAVIESLQPSMEDIRTMAGDSAWCTSGANTCPSFRWPKPSGLDGVEDITKGMLVVVEAEEGKAALFVDELLGQHQVVIKSLEANYRKVPGHLRRHHHGRWSGGHDPGCLGGDPHGPGRSNPRRLAA
jgi:two-component system chemotaxis sensor kinase CheA